MKILNGESSSDDEHVHRFLGSSKQEFEAQLNKGFERNLPRYKKKNAEMMANEWSNKVAASDRAEAKLYPILNIETDRYVSIYQKNKRRSSIY